MTNIDDPYNLPITYTYDAIGNRTNLVYPDGKAVTDTYDAANRLITVTDWSNQATGYIYDKANRLITVTLPNTVTTVYAYDNANRTTQVIHKRSGNVLGQYNFILDGVGNRKIVTETLAQPSAPNITSTINYAYDPLYRVTGANYTGSLTYTFAYRYDPVGNRTAQTATITSTLVTTYTYDNANRLASAGGVAYTWDSNGNLTNDGSAAYLYDSANRMISTTLGGVSTQFNYNGDGARLRQIAAGTPTTYTQDLAAPLPVVLQSKTGSATTSYEFSNGTRPIGQFNANGSGTWGYLLPDALGSVRQIAALNGSLTLAKTYDPLGRLTSANYSTGAQIRFDNRLDHGYTLPPPLINRRNKP